MLKLRARLLDIEPAIPLVILSEEDARELGVRASDRVRIRIGKKEITSIFDTSKRMVKVGQIGFVQELLEYGIKAGKIYEIRAAPRPKSVGYIKKKLGGNELKKEEIDAIIDDIYNNNLSDIELGAFISAVYTHGYSTDEALAVTRRMILNGQCIKWPGRKTVVQEHTIGGVPGNRVTLIMVPILAATGLIVPKTSSRAITSPAGTSDVVEVFAPVAFDVSGIKKIVKKAGACMVWGGAVDLAPVDDKLIRAEYPLSLDPEGQVLASVMSKNAATGAKYLLMDIPFGPGTKVEKFEQARIFAKRFKILGEKLGMQVECALTRGDQPIGNGIGPVLEAIDCIEILNGRGPADLRKKSVELAGILLRMTRHGDESTAEDILDSGRALKKFREIVIAQGGDPDVPLDRLLGKFSNTICAKNSGIVLKIKNEDISKIARYAGAPKDKGAGIYLSVKVGQTVEKGEKLFEIFAEKDNKLDEAVELLKKLEPIIIGLPEELLVEEI